MTKTRNNNNNTNRSKTTVRTNKPRSPQAVTAQINARKVNKALNNNIFTQEPQYRVSITFTLNNTQDLNDPIDWVEDRMGTGTIDRLLMGSGTCLMTGLRDFGFEGTKSEMTAVLKQFARSPFRINSIYTSMVEAD